MGAIVVFVVATGAEASLVRAAIMGALLLICQQAGRLFQVRNVLMGAALAMTFWEPRVLAFDLGFQLSFLAVIGIAYLKPRLEKLITIKFPWRDAILTTLAAEAFVLPMAFAAFGEVSPWGILATPLLAPLVPLTMAFGFLTGAVGFISYYASLPFALIANILLSYALAVVHLFAIAV